MSEVRSLSGPRDQKSPDAAPIHAVQERSEEVIQPLSDLSFSEVFQRHTRYLWRALLGLGVPHSDVDDACQEVLLVAHRRLADIDPRTLRSWLYGVCVRVASSHRRKLRTRRELSSDALPEREHSETPFDRVAAGQAEERLLAALSRLDEDKRAAFVLYEVEELTLREVAEALGCPLQTAYSRLEAARTQVKRAFAGGEP